MVSENCKRIRDEIADRVKLADKHYAMYKFYQERVDTPNATEFDALDMNNMVECLRAMCVDALYDLDTAEFQIDRLEQKIEALTEKKEVATNA